MVKKLLYFLRWGHWPKKMRYPNGIPRVERGTVVTTYRAASPFWEDGKGGRTLYLDDGSRITAGEPE